MKPIKENSRNRIRKNSWNNNRHQNPKNILKKNSRQTNKSDFRNINIRESQLKLGNEELYFLSNANLNIINILNTCISDDIYKDSSFINNNRERLKDNSRFKKPTWKTEKGKEVNKKKSIKTHISSNKAVLGKESLVNKKFKFITSIDSNSINNSVIKKSNLKKKNSEKEILLEGKNQNELKRKKINKFNKYFSNIEENNTMSKLFKKKYNIRANSNKKLNNLGLDSYFIFNSKDKPIYKERKSDFLGHLNQNELFQINENINNDVNYIQLKKKICKLKKKIESKCSVKSIIRKKNDSEIIPHKSIIKNNNKNEINNKIGMNNYKSNLIKKNTIRSSLYSELLEKEKNELIDKKYRFLTRKCCLYDSIDDEEYNDEVIDYYIPPNSIYIKIFDILLFISALFYFVIVPFYLPINTNVFILKENKFFKILLISIDIIYIIDLINNFFRAYQTYDDHLIRRTRKIFKHYIQTWFLIDFIQIIPFFSIFLLLENLNSKNNENYKINPLLYILLLIKIIKLYKMFNDNSTIDHYTEIFTQKELIDVHGGIIINILLTLFFLNLTACLFIFIGFNSYPNWIIGLNIQDESFLEIYLTSIYFVIVTITTVGYGDITGFSIPEISFQILLLIIGTIAYSFVISYISNYIIKSHKKSMSYEKNLEILREIKFHHPTMKKSLYQEVLRSLHNEQIFERKDKHLLFDCLPYSLKNELIFEMYRPLIQNFIFFKDVDNSDFIIKVATSLKSLISVKGDVLIEEGDFVKEIIFVKNGVIGLNISIDLDHIEYSVKKYIGKYEFNKMYLKTSIINQRRNTKTLLLDTNIDSFLINKTSDSAINSENENNIENFEDIKILEIRKNEHFGDALIFLNERCPLVVKVRTSTAELLILRKMEAIEIYTIYPNIWKRINKKSLYNMEQIYMKIKRAAFELSNRYNLKTIKNTLSKFYSREKIIKNKMPKKVKFSQSIIGSTKEETNPIHTKEDNINESESKKTILLNSNKLNFDNKSFNDKSQGNNSDISSNSFTLKSKVNKNSSHLLITSSNLKKTGKESEIKISQNKNSDKKNSTISVIKNNSFQIVCESDKDIIKEKGKKNLEISFHEREFCIKGKSLTIKEESKESIKVNESINSNKLKESTNSLLIKNQNTKKSSFRKNEDIYYNAFINLNSTKENSLKFDSCYENINELSNNKYIRDQNLQNKTKQFIINECSREIISKFHHSPTQTQQRRRSSLEILNSLREKISLEQPKNKTKNNIDKSPLSRFKTLERRENVFAKRNSLLSSNNKITNSLSRFASFRNNPRNNYNISSPNKIKRKLTRKKLAKVKKKLYTITKNIENTNNAIKNPNEFYMNFFNNIINKKSQQRVPKVGEENKPKDEKKVNNNS